MADRSRLPELPGATANRAIWARNAACENPSCVQADHELLPWVFCEEDDLWYSFDGNYSGTSPEDKKQKAADRQLSQEVNTEYYEAVATNRYLDWLYWSKVRGGVLARDNDQCQLCGKNGDSKLHVHHIMKRKHGGTDHDDNLITVCPKCHSAADNKLYDPDWK